MWKKLVQLMSSPMIVKVNDCSVCDEIIYALENAGDRYVVSACGCANGLGGMVNYRAWCSFSDWRL
ncbi:MAG: hypothetical protein O7B25_05925 [Gammaproteobacteria bacterium]|nr:hypothetical protein [Gammaproteobacteria bacterium]